MTRITYDEDSALGYVQILADVPGGIKQTLDLDVSYDMMVDLDKKGRIVGIEFFRGEAHTLKEAFETSRTFVKTGATAILQLQQKKPLSTFRQAGIAFHFAGADYKDLVAIEIENVARYDAK
ncbi:MAG: DUF2283 domain-containing protein [Solibacillus sp.]